MDLILIRHGQTNHNLDKRYQGSTDAPLNHEGVSQAQKLAQRLSDNQFDVVYSSDLQRSLQTAELIAKKHQLEVYQDGRFREISFGDWEEMTYNEIQAQSPDLLEKWLNNPEHTSPPNGETLKQLSERVKSAMEEIKYKHPNQTVLVVTHGGVIRALLCLTLGVELNRYSQFDSVTGSLSWLSFYKETASLKLFNDVSHLHK